MGKFTKFLAPAVGFLVLTAGFSEAAAQTTASAPSDSVNERARPEYDARGLRVRGFVLRPTLTGDVGYLDNVFAVDNNPQDDVVFGIRPRVDVRSDWSRHQVRGSFRSDTLFFSEFQSENRTSYTGDLDLRFDLGSRSEVGVGAVFGRDVQGRTSPETPVSSLDLVRSSSRLVYVSGAHEFNRLRISARLSRYSDSFRDIVSNTNQLVSLADRNRVEYVAGGRLSYALTPDTSFFFDGGWSTRNFPVTPASGVLRSSTGQSFLGGFRTELGRLIRGEAAVGYFRENYDAVGVGTVGGVATRVRLEYFLSRLTTISFNADRATRATGVLQSAGLVETTLNLRADHELRRNVLLNLGGGYQRRAFRGVDRDDTFTFGEVGARYLINRKLSLGGSYRFDNGRTDNVLGRNFTLNSVRVGLNLNL